MIISHTPQSSIIFQGRLTPNPKTHMPKPKQGNIFHNGLMASLIALASFAPINMYSQKNNPLSSNTNNTEILIKASEMQLSNTPNENVFYDKNKSTYYMWDTEKQNFKRAKNIEAVYKTGYIKTKKGEYLSPNGKIYIKKDLGTTLIPAWGRYKDVGQALAVVNGYKQSDIARDLYQYNISNNQQLELYYDDETQRYLRWNNSNKKFEPSDVTEVVGEYYSVGDKRFKIDYSGTTSTVREATEEEYQVNKSGLFKLKDYSGIYTDKKEWYDDRTFYYWNNKTSELIPFGDKVDIQKMLAEKADGKIGGFRQGDIGDCWLLAPINGMLHHPNPILREKFTKQLEKCLSVDDENNITVDLKGIHKKYTISSDEIDSVLVKNNHYAIGSREMVAIEMAFEKYFRTLIPDIKNRRKYTNTFNMSVPPYEVDSSYVLDGGHSYNAIHIITGKETHHVVSTPVDNIIRIDNKYQSGTINEQFLSEKLKRNIVVVSYKEPNAKEAHAVSLYSIDKDNVWVIDSNINELEIDKKVKPTKIPKDKFFSELESVTYTDLSTDITPEKSKPIKAKPDVTPDAKVKISAWHLK